MCVYVYFQQKSPHKPFLDHQIKLDLVYHFACFFTYDAFQCAVLTETKNCYFATDTVDIVPCIDTLYIFWFVDAHCTFRFSITRNNNNGEVYRKHRQLVVFHARNNIHTPLMQFCDSCSFLQCVFFFVFYCCFYKKRYDYVVVGVCCWSMNEKVNK